MSERINLIWLQRGQYVSFDFGQPVTVVSIFW